MKRKKNIFARLIEYPYFDKRTLGVEASRFGLGKHSVDAYLKDSSIIKLKRDFYVHKERFNRDKGDLSYVFNIANNLRRPSYISLESAMQFHGLMTESIAYVVTSVTSKVTRNYNTKLGKFIYRSIKEDLFNYYETYTKSNYKFLIATKFKCIFDYLYFFTNASRAVINNSIFDDLRIDVMELSKKDRAKLNSLINNYTKWEIKL